MDALPVELRKLLVGLMDDKSKRVMRLANTQWFSDIKYSDFTIYLATTEIIQQAAERLSKYCWPIQLTLKKSLTAFLPSLSESYMKLTNLKSLEIDDVPDQIQNQLSVEEKERKYKWSPLSNLKNIQKLVVHKINAFKSQIHEMTNLTSLDLSLDFGNQHYTDEDCESLRSMTKLRDLAIRITSYDKSTPLAYCPTNLTKLLLRYDGFGYEPLQIFDMASYSQLKSLKLFSDTDVDLSNLPATLERLDLDWAEAIIQNPQLLNNCTNLTELGIRISTDGEFDTDMLDPHVLSNLKKFTADFAPTNLNFLAHLKKAEHLSVAVQYDIAAIQHLSHSLKSLKLICEDCNAIGQFSQLTGLTVIFHGNQAQNWTAIEQLTQLKTLALSAPDDSLDLTALTNLESLRVDALNWTPNYSRLTNLTSLTVDNLNDVQSLCDTLTLLTRVNHLDITSDHLNTEFWITVARLPNLRDLRVQGNKPPFSDVLLLRDISSLTSLTVPLPADYSSDSGRENFHLFTQLSRLQALEFVFQIALESRVYTPPPEQLRDQLPHLRCIKRRRREILPY